ncbi:MAG: glutathione peroxidase [Pseudomonadota bacterium]
MTYRQIGDRVPTVTFRTRTDSDWLDRTTEELFAGQRVVLFALPGAFTPTCSASQLPGYNSLAPQFRANGIDRIICLSVNDAFVMREWQDSQQVDQVDLIPDGNGEFTQAMGFLVDKQDLGFGKRSWRYAMIVDDGVIEALFVEPNEPGDPYGVSDPLTVLRHLNPSVIEPDRYAVFTRKGCPHCRRAKDLLTQQGLAFDVIEIPSTDALLAVTGERSTPQVFVNGERIGGADDLAAHLGAAERAA